MIECDASVGYSYESSEKSGKIVAPVGVERGPLTFKNRQPRRERLGIDRGEVPALRGSYANLSWRCSERITVIYVRRLASAVSVQIA